MKFYELANVILFLLLIGGLYLPYVKKVVKNKFVLGIFLVLAIIPILGSPVYSLTLSLPLVYRDVSTMVRLFNVVSGLSCWSTVFKQHSFYYNQNRFEELIRMWDSLSEDVLYPNLRRDILLRSKKTTDRWIISFEILLTLSAAFFSLVPYYSRKLEHPTALVYSTDSPEFEILVTYELILTIYICLGANYAPNCQKNLIYKFRISEAMRNGCSFAIWSIFSHILGDIPSLAPEPASVHGYNSFLMQIVAYEEAYCQYLKTSLGLIFSSLKVGDRGEINIQRNTTYSDIRGNSASFKNVRTYGDITSQAERELRLWVQQHQNLIKFHNKLLEIYHLPLSVEFAVLVIIICIIAFMIITNSMSPIMVFISLMYCTTTYTIFYVACYYGDLVGLESSSLHEDALGNSWYLYPKKLRTNLHIIIMKCNNPMTLRAFDLYPLNSRSFAKIFRHSYSFFMFLLQVISRSKMEGVL